MMGKQHKSRARPAPNSLIVPFAQPWKVVTPSAFRYENQTWIDDFFEHGKLRLGTFAKFATYPDEARGDRGEGSAVCYAETSDNKTVVLQQRQGISSAVLCCSLRLDRELLNAFDRDSVFEITNTVGFASEIARQLPGFRHGMEGSCIYRPERLIKRAIDFEFDEYKRDDGTVDMRMINDLGHSLGGEELLLLKHKRYATQQEYRFLWELDSIEQDYIDITAPKAVHFCRRVEAQEW
jgi:hypothetical protein